MSNSIVVNHRVGIATDVNSSASVDGVLWYDNDVNAGGEGTHTVTNEYFGNPAFAADGYHLTHSSAAIGRGVSAGVISDIDNHVRSRTAPDLGADEIPRIYLPLIVRNFSPIESSSALYVWRDPHPLRNGTPINLPEAQVLADFAVDEGIGIIYYDNFGCGPAGPNCPPGAEQQDSSTLAQILHLLHEHGLRIEALYTDNTRIADVLNYNEAVSIDARFDAIRLNIESFPSGGSEPATSGDLDLYAQAISEAGGIPVYVSISHHWDNVITYNGESKEAYKHILDIVAGIDVQTAQDSSSIITAITKEEVCYGNQVGKPVNPTIETYDVVSHLGLRDFNTFFEEGEIWMKSELANIDYAAPGINAPCVNPRFTNFSYHFYQQSYGSPDLPGW